jgi:hypothetical protein
MNRRLFIRQWGWPIALALLTLFGLFSALIGQGGLWWGLSWVALAAPLLTGVRHIVRPATDRKDHARSRR